MQTRKNIRHAVRTLLTGEINSVGDRVFASRYRSLFPDQDPTILIYTLSEASTQIQNAPDKMKRRTLQLLIEIRAEADENIDDVFDDIAGSIEAIMDKNPRLLDSAKNNTLTTTESEMRSSGDTVIGSQTLTYEVLYFN